MSTDYFQDLDRAKALGREYADNGIAGGELSPQESPLSGEWWDDITVNDVLIQLGVTLTGPAHEFEREDVASFWEDGYFSAPWPKSPSAT